LVYKKFTLFLLFAASLAIGQGFSFKEESALGGKSLIKAVALSALVPGTGEYYLEYKGRAYIFWGTDASIWLGYYGFSKWGNIKEEEYKAYAARYADALPENKDSRFFDNVALYDSRDDYNLYTLLSEGDRTFLYPETRDYYWMWQTNDNKNHFASLRSSSKTAKRNASILLAVAGLNRLASIVDVMRVYYTPKSNEEHWRLGFDAVPDGDNITCRVLIGRRF